MVVFRGVGCYSSRRTAVVLDRMDVTGHRNKIDEQNVVQPDRFLVVP